MCTTGAIFAFLATMAVAVVVEAPVYVQVFIDAASLSPYVDISLRYKSMENNESSFDVYNNNKFYYGLKKK